MRIEIEDEINGRVTRIEITPGDVRIRISKLKTGGLVSVDPFGDALKGAGIVAFGGGGGSYGGQGGKGGVVVTGGASGGLGGTAELTYMGGGDGCARCGSTAPHRHYSRCRICGREHNSAEHAGGAGSPVGTDPNAGWREACTDTECEREGVHEAHS